MFITPVVLLLYFSAFGQEVLQWRGNDRTGNYPDSNLLKEWPEAGPTLLWEFDDLGNGYSSAAITSKNIYINGEKDTINYLFALDLNGKLLWKSKVGKEWIINYPGTRTTPTVVGDLIYTTTGWGIVACFDTKTRTKKWSKEFIKDFHGKFTRYGFSESVLVDEDKVFCSPGNADTNVVALDRFTGEIKWICKGLGQKTAYCSPLLIKTTNRKILVTFSESALLGIDTKDGKLLWSHSQIDGNDIQVNTPLYENGYIYYVTGNGNGSVKLKLSEDGSKITEIWKNKSAKNSFGGFVKLNDFIYASGNRKRRWFSIDATTGQVKDSLKFDRGSTIAADGMLYMYNERGYLGLCKPNGAKMELISSFRIMQGTKSHFSHPVINNGILYLRRGNSLLAFDIKK